MKLAYAEFDYNRSPTFATDHLQIEVVYDVNPYLPIDLVTLPKEELVHKDAEVKLKSMLKLYQQIHDHIESVNEVYKKKSKKYNKPQVFDEGDLVWSHLRKERFPRKRKNKLMPRTEGPCKVVARVRGNAYKTKLSGEYGVMKLLMFET